MEPNKEYTYCLNASNPEGSTPGNPEPFKTLPLPPEIANESSSAVTQTGATLSAGINPNNQETSYTFQYGVGVAGQIPLVIPAPVMINSTIPLTGFGEQPVSVSTGLLQPRTTYDYRVVATNAAAEKVEGEIREFTTVATPLVTIAAAQGVTRTTATISGTVNPGGLATFANFVYVEAAKYAPGATECPGKVACAYAQGYTGNGELPGSDYTAHAAGPLTLKELKPGTTYHYALLAGNFDGHTVSPDGTFTTSPPTPPSATTGEASAITQTSATIAGTVDMAGLPGRVGFEVRTDASFPEPGSGLLDGATTASRSEEISYTFGPYLQPGTTFYYRAVATNVDGTSAGAIRPLASPCPPSLCSLACFRLFPSSRSRKSKPKKQKKAKRRQALSRL